MVKLTIVPVISLALSEAMKTAMFAISSSVISRRGWVLLASNSCHCSQVIPDALARGSKASLIVRPSRPGIGNDLGTVARVARKQDQGSLRTSRQGIGNDLGTGSKASLIVRVSGMPCG